MDIPENWNNHSEWDLYYKANPVDIDEISANEIRDSLKFYMAAQGKKIWISGCGCEITPWLFANLNCCILATDISTIAIDFQKKLLSYNPFEKLKNLEALLAELDIKAEKKFVTPRIEIADFRNTIPEELFDIILNTKAIQGFPKEDIEKAATVFFKATNNGGTFVASTMNVQGERRTEIENVFLKAGYFIPNIKAEQWYREKLNETGILYCMVLGNPVIPHWGQYENKGGEEQEAKDKETIRSFRQEYQQRLQQNYEEDKKNYRPEVDKLAYIIYNTG